jgi:rSAM/selenodomain-associated transferase 1
MSNPSQLSVPKGWALGIQSEGDLGERLSQLFLTSCGRGISRVVVLGSDSPTLPLDVVNEAFDELATHEVVLGPAEDGGYYLLGARRWIPGIFRDIPWGTAEVLDTTIAALDREDISYRRLPAWYDIDRDEDLRKLRSEIDYLKRRSSPYVPRRVDEALPTKL